MITSSEAWNEVLNVIDMHQRVGGVAVSLETLERIVQKWQIPAAFSLPSHDRDLSEVGRSAITSPTATSSTLSLSRSARTRGASIGSAPRVTTTTRAITAARTRKQTRALKHKQTWLGGKRYALVPVP